MRTFNLQRDDDETGISGTGVVAQGVEFDDGTVAMKWLTSTASLGYYNSIEELVTIHGHEGRTYPVFIEGEEPADFSLVSQQKKEIERYKSLLEDAWDNRESWANGYMEILEAYNLLAVQHYLPTWDDRSE